MLTAWLTMILVLVHDPAQGQIAVALAQWDRLTTDQKKTFVLEAATDCYRAGWQGRVTVWSEDGQRVVASYPPGDRVRILRGWQSEPFQAVLPTAGGAGDAAPAVLLLGMAGLAVVLVILIQVAILRWVFRVNTIVAKQEEANELLGRIAATLEGKKTGVFDP